MKVTSYIYKLLPKSLTSRFVLIIAVPMILAQVIGIYIFYDRHWSNIFTATSNMVAKEIKLILEVESKYGIKEAIKESKLLSIKVEHITAREAKKELVKTSPSLIEFVKILEKTTRKRVLANLINNDTEILILIQSDNGYFKMRRSVKPLINPTTYIFAIWMIALTCILLAVSIIFSRNQIKSILDLASAIFSLNNSDVQHYKPSGALEIRRAGLAFLRMKERIERYITKRTQMLAMISHDLKTPLTRLKLQLEIMDESEEILNMKKDLMSMQQMISSYLDFARGEGGENFKKIRVLDWFDDNIMKDSYGKLLISFVEDSQNLEIMVKPLSFKRAIENIITNASKYSTRLVIKITKEEGQMLLTMEDNGTGISDNEKSKVFKPFYRSDSSRHIDLQGSVGLGLSITREIILGHSGDITLYDSPSGGLGVKITIPLLERE